MRKNTRLLKFMFATILSLGVVVTQIQPMMVYAEDTMTDVKEDEAINDVEVDDTTEIDVDSIFDNLYTEITNNIPEGQEVLSYVNNYQSMEPESMTYYRGSGTTEVNNGLTLTTNGSTVAAWEKAPFLSSGIMEVTFQIDKDAATTDMGVSLKSNGGSEGVAIRYESNDTWVIQGTSASGTWKTVNAPGGVLTPNEDHVMRVANVGARLVVYIDDVLIYDNVDFLTEADQGDVLGQFGLYNRTGDNTFKVSEVSIKGVGNAEDVKVKYVEDYESITNEELNWVNASSTKIIDDGTGNKVLEISASDKRVTDLNSPNVSNGTLSLRYKVQKYGSGFAFGFRHNDNSSVFSEIGIDGSGTWVPESSTGWGSNLGLPKPDDGVWNNLMFNFEGKQVTIYLNKELIGVREFGDFTDNAGKFGLRLRNATLLIDDVIYTEEILSPEVVKQYENDFEDGITGNWSSAVSIIQDGRNGILQIPNSGSMITLQETADLSLSHGTMTAKIKPVREDVKLQIGNMILEWDSGKWMATVNGVSNEFEGDAKNTSLKEKKWNNIAIKFSEGEIVLSINGEEATANLSETLQIGSFGLQSSGTVYLDEFLFTEKLLTLDTEKLTDKFVYEEHYATETTIDYTDLNNVEQVDGKLKGTISANSTAINNEVIDTAHGVYQFKLSANQPKYGFTIGNTTFTVDESGKWIATNTLGNSKVIGTGQAYTPTSEVIVRFEILEGQVSLSVNNVVLGTVPLEDYTGGIVGIYNPNDTEMELSLNAMAVEELRVYEENYEVDSWQTLEGNVTITRDDESVSMKLPGVGKAYDSFSPKVLDQKVSFDFKTDVDASATGGRYGFMLRTANEKEHVAIEHDINGVWRASFAGNEYKFPVSYEMKKDETYHVDASVIGTNVSFKLTDSEGVTTDFGVVDVKELSGPGHFGVKSWYGTKSITISNLKVIESPTLSSWYLDAVTTSLVNDGLTVEIDEDYPRVISYEYNGKTIDGQKDSIKTIVLNGVPYEPEVSSQRSDDGTTQDYTLTFSEIEVVIKLSISVEENQVTSINVNEINEMGSFLVRTFSMGNNTFLYTDSSKEGSSYANSTTSGAWHSVSEELVDNTEDMAKGGTIGTTMSMISEGGLAASMENNVMSGGNKIMMNKELKPLISKVGLTNGVWTYRHAQDDTPEELPWAKIVIGEDQNEDAQVDWQDAAILYREQIYTKNFESEAMANNMMYIAFNFASQANDPFLNSLENGKVLYNYTDGFGQMVLHKGYQAEGHDDDIPSYSNIGMRQGGEADFNTLIKEGKKYNMNIGVHLNATEYHLDANELFYNNLTGASTGRLAGGWDWIDDAYYVDQTKEVLSGELQERFESLVNIAPGLDFFYIDVYTGNDYNAYKLLEYANDLGIKVGTEFSGPIEPGVSFVHWGPDLGYPNKGNASTLSRIVKNDQDIFVGHSLFKGQKIPGVTTWGDSKPDIQQGVTVFYNDVLPTKYMQHFGVMKVEEDIITFDEKITSARNNAGMVELRKDGNLVSTWKDHGTTLDEGQRHTAESLSLIPWKWDTSNNEVLTADTGAKLYHWNPFGTSSTWDLTEEFANVTSLTMYELTQQGKVKVADIPVVDGQVTINADKNTPYVLYKTGVTPLEDAQDWGEGSAVKDFAFNAETLDGTDAWTSEGSATVETVAGNTSYLAPTGNLSRWNKYVKLEDEANISQTMDLDLLEAGKDYTISLWAQVSDGQKATLDVELNGDVISNYVTGQDKSHQSSFKFVNTDYQRLTVKFNVPEDLKTASIKISTDNVAGAVLIDDIKVWQHLTVNEDLNNADFVVNEDFENVSAGWGPFEYLGGSRQTHIASDRSNVHDNNPVVEKDSGLKGPVMTWVLDGDNSLKINENGNNRGVKTNEDMVKLEPNTAYDLSFIYTMHENVQYNVQVKSRTTGDVVGDWDLIKKDNNGKTNKLESDYETFDEMFTTGNADDYQVIIKTVSHSTNGNSTTRTLILDNFVISTQADFADLQALIDELDAITEDGYTSTSYKKFTEVLEAVKLTVDASSSAQKIKDAIKALEDAHKSLAKLVGLQDLKDAIDDAKTYEKEEFSTVTWNALQEVLQDAELVAEAKDDNEAISNMTQQLFNAIEALVDVTELQKEIKLAELLTNDDYTSESWDALQATLDLSREVAKEAVSDDEVTSQITMLKNAVSKLVAKGDVSNLKGLVESQRVESENYTTSSYEAYKVILDEAKSMVAENDSSQADIDEMVQDLTNASDNLIPLYYKHVDSSTGIMIEWQYGVLPVDPTIKVGMLAVNSDDYKLMQEHYANKLDKMIGYEISVEDAGVEVQPNGKLKITMPIHTDIAKDQLALFHVTNSGIEEVIGFSIVDDSVVFETDSLSSFVLAEKKKIKDKEDNETVDNETDDKIDVLTGVANYTMLYVAIAAVGLSLLLILKKRRNKEIQ